MELSGRYIKQLRLIWKKYESKINNFKLKFILIIRDIFFARLN